jgi:hypothetical protein
VGTYVSTDLLRVSVENGVVKYRKNGTLLYESLVPPTYSVARRHVARDPGAALTEVVIAGSLRTWR